MLCGWDLGIHSSSCWKTHPIIYFASPAAAVLGRAPSELAQGQRMPFAAALMSLQGPPALPRLPSPRNSRNSRRTAPVPQPPPAPGTFPPFAWIPAAPRSPAGVRTGSEQSRAGQGIPAGAAFLGSQIPLSLKPFLFFTQPFNIPHFHLKVLSWELKSHVFRSLFCTSHNIPGFHISTWEGISM